MAIQKADPALRRTALSGLAGVAAIGFIALQWGQPKLMEAIATQEPAQAVRLLTSIAIAAFVPALPIAYFTYKVARRIHSSQRFPPPGMAVIRDTEILIGEPAKHLGNKLMVVSLLLGSMALFAIAYIPYLIDRLGLD